MPPKRKHYPLSIKQKIIERLDRGESGRELANEFGVGTSTISDIKKNKDKILGFIKKCNFNPDTRKTLRNAEYPEMEIRLYEWYCTQKSRHIPLTHDILAAKAKQFYIETYGNNDFRASKCWIHNFKMRHCQGTFKECSEKVSNEQSSTHTSTFLTAFAEKINQLNLAPSQIYHADKSTLYWKMLPEKTAPGQNKSKERVSFLACSNADGSHKLKLLMIGSAKHPKEFKNKNVPVEYKSSANALMTSDIFLDWFHSSFVSQVRSHLKSLHLPEKALFIIDSSSHGNTEELTSEDGQITTMFLPSNSTEILKPMFQNPIKLIKVFYRKSLLAHILSHNEEDVVEVLRTFNLKDAVCLLSNAWGNVSPETLEKSWQKIMAHVTNNGPDTKYNAEDISLSSTEEITDISDMLNVILTEEHLTDAEIRNWLENDEHRDDNEVLKINTTSQTVKNDEAVKSFNLCIKWAEENNISLDDVCVLQRLKETAFMLNRKRKKLNK